MKAIFDREFKAYFKSPTGFVFLGAFFFFASLMFVTRNLFFQTVFLEDFFANIGLVFIFVIPVLTMRLFSEEKRNKTDQLLLTAPVTVTQIVLGKFFAALCVLLIGCISIMFYIAVLARYGSPAIAEVLVGYFGLFLMGMFATSIGMFMSSLTESQVISAISTLFILMFSWLLSNLSFSFANAFKGAFAPIGTLLDKLMGFLSINDRLYEFTVGTLNIVPVFYFVSLTALFVILTIRVIEKRRWR